MHQDNTHKGAGTQKCVSISVSTERRHRNSRYVHFSLVMAAWVQGEGARRGDKDTKREGIYHEAYQLTREHRESKGHGIRSKGHGMRSKGHGK